MMKIYTCINVLLIVIATLIPNITKAEKPLNIEVLTIQKVIDSKEEFGLIAKVCNDWKLTLLDVKDFFETAKPFVFDAEVSSFDMFHCNMEGILILNDKQKEYRINLGGSAFIYDSEKQQGFGCSQGQCLNYIYYEPYLDNE